MARKSALGSRKELKKYQKALETRERKRVRQEQRKARQKAI
jgi:hypothetical protein